MAAKIIQFPVQPQKPDRTVEARWGGYKDVFKDGYVAVPTSFLRSLNTMALPFKISAVEAMFIIQLMSYKWSAEDPFPGYKAIAKHMGITPVYARAIGRRLEGKRLLNRVVRVGSTNRFDLKPLFAKLNTHVTGGRKKVVGKAKRKSKKVVKQPSGARKKVVSR
jgi:hypothetical protein